MIVGNGHLVFEAADPIAIRSVLPHAKSIVYRGKPHIAVKHELDAVTVLRNLGIDAPSPVNFGWTYPGRHKPYEHQRATVEFLTVNRRAFVLSGLGSGKTNAALWAAEYLKTVGLVDRVLIVCPKSCTHKVWGDEIFQTLMHRSAVVVEGARDRKRDLVKSDSDFLIINHDGIMSVADIVAKDKRISLVIYDEMDAIRNSQTERYKTIKRMLRPDVRLWLLSATPCPGGPTDAWALARLVRPETVPAYFTAFKRLTMFQVSTFKWVPKPEAAQLVFEALQPAVRFRTEDCIDLPPITYQNRQCELSPEQTKMIKAMTRDLVTSKDGVTISAANAAVKMVKILQLAAGVVYDDQGHARLIDSPDRLKTLIEIIEESDRKVIVWVPFKHVMLHLKKELSKRWGVELINGDVSGTERARIVTAFQEDGQEPKVLIAHPATAAHGLTLTASNVCVWYGPTFSALHFSQANGRINRPGQKHSMSVICLASTAVEWGAYDIANTKVDRQKKVLDLYHQVLDTPT